MREVRVRPVVRYLSRAVAPVLRYAALYSDTAMARSPAHSRVIFRSCPVGKIVSYCEVCRYF